jgi:hypothetical protein
MFILMYILANVLFFQNVKTNQSKKFIPPKGKIAGMDQRYLEHNKNNIHFIKKIKNINNNYSKKRLYDILTCENIAKINKVKEIADNMKHFNELTILKNDKYELDLLMGGLYDDFNFRIDETFQNLKR